MAHYRHFHLGFLIYFWYFLERHSQATCSKFKRYLEYCSYCSCTDSLWCVSVCLRPWTPWVSCRVHVHMNNEHYPSRSVTALTLLPHFPRRPNPQMQVYIYCFIWKFSILPPGNPSGKLPSSIKAFLLDLLIL